jgi:pimeloyl-ACP methyl ester carboxylesterase
MEYGIAEPARLGTVDLPDGRRLGWAQWGPNGGLPVLFFSGAAMGRSLAFGADLLDGLGVRLIAVDRPGLGASDPDPDRTLTHWPRDVAQFCLALGLTGVRIVAFSQGAPFGLACAAAGITAAVAIVSGQDDLQDAAFADRVDPHLAGLLQAVAADPAGVEAMFANSSNAETLWDLIMASVSEPDRAIYTSPTFAPAYRRALAEGFSQGAAGYARDLVLTMGRWPFDPAAIHVPVDLWFGGRDISAVHSPDHGERLAARIPTARRHLRSEAGGALLWTHAEPILTSLLAARPPS